MIKTKNNISTNLCCIVQHTKKIVVTVDTSNSYSHIYKSDEYVLDTSDLIKRTLKKSKNSYLPHGKEISNEDNINKMVNVSVWLIMDLKLPFSCAW